MVNTGGCKKEFLVSKVDAAIGHTLAWTVKTEQRNDTCKCSAGAAAQSALTYSS